MFSKWIQRRRWRKLQKQCLSGKGISFEEVKRVRSIMLPVFDVEDERTLKQIYESDEAKALRKKTGFDS